MIHISRLFFITFLALFFYTAHLTTLDESKIPPLHDGDLIFQTSWTDQTAAIGLATLSLYIHTGIIKHMDKGWVVIHAGKTVKETPLHDWIQGGILHRFAIYRDRDLTPEQAEKVLAAAQAYYGKPYDNYFSFDNDAIYCSELTYLSFKDAGVPLGKVEKVGDLYINNSFSKKLVEQRWQGYPACQGKNYTFDQCYDVIISGKIITPEALAEDPHLDRIFSNYP